MYLRSMIRIPVRGQFQVPQSSEPTSPRVSKGSRSAPLVGGIVGGLAGLSAFSFLSFLLYRRRLRQKGDRRESSNITYNSLLFHPRMQLVPSSIPDDTVYQNLWNGTSHQSRSSGGNVEPFTLPIPDIGPTEVPGNSPEANSKLIVELRRNLVNAINSRARQVQAAAQGTSNSVLTMEGDRGESDVIANTLSIATSGTTQDSGQNGAHQTLIEEIRRLQRELRGLIGPPSYDSPPGQSR